MPAIPCPPPAPAAGVPTGARTASGSSTTAVVPPYGDRHSVTSMPCRAASRPTTYNPPVVPGRIEVVGVVRVRWASSICSGFETEAPVVDLQDELHPGPPGTQGDLGVGR